MLLLLAGCRQAALEERADDSGQRLPLQERQATGVASRLQAISAPGRGVVWVSGVDGTVLRTSDGGETWLDVSPARSETAAEAAVDVESADETERRDLGALELRDVEAFSESVAYALAAGPGESSRIFKTIDGGRSWEEQWRNRDPDGFFDCFAFWTQDRALLYGDSVAVGETAAGSAVPEPQRRFPFWTTVDGADWRELTTAAPARPQGAEGGFAASGTCLVAGAAGAAWVGTGASGHARVLRTLDYGRTWVASETGIDAEGSAAGVTTLAFIDDTVGFAAGGDIADPQSVGRRVAVTGDGGMTWSLLTDPGFPGAIYGLAALAGPKREAKESRTLGSEHPGASAWLLAVGPGGADLSYDGGASWLQLSREAWWSAAFEATREPGATGVVAWLAGPDGRVERVVFAGSPD